MKSKEQMNLWSGKEPTLQTVQVFGIVDFVSNLDDPSSILPILITRTQPISKMVETGGIPNHKLTIHDLAH